jgi:hypothetical protein
MGSAVVMCAKNELLESELGPRCHHAFECHTSPQLPHRLLNAIENTCVTTVARLRNAANS